MSDEQAVPPDFLASGRLESAIRHLGVDLIGKSIGVYHITEKLGAGGMGEVYRATDTKLHRDVAIKVLPDLFVRDAERLARFIREAQTLASLNHPNIAIIHGLEQTGDAHALVMELVTGEDLSQRIARGAIPMDEALPIAKQIADALEAAHEQGIIHRDLKPANIKVRADGTVKVLDFGLAKAMEPVGRAPNVSPSPTITQAMTQAGIILGTAAYMSPEQALGKPVDKRTDIWAFGCVLYEMLTGVRAFAGDEVSDTLAFVITKEPAWSALPASTPASIRRMLRRCLAKDRHQRLSDIADARLEIAEVGAEQVAEVSSTPKPFSRPKIALAFASVLALAVWIAISPWAPWQSQPALVSPHRLSAELGMDGDISPNAGLALSPDGSVLAFPGISNGSSQLYRRPLEQLQAVALPGTAGASLPFFSPDGLWIGFFAEGKLKKVPVAGGAVVPICDAPDPRGGAWGEDGDILFSLASSVSSPRNSLLRVSADGGTPQPATTLADDEVTHRWPQVLPGARAILYTAHNRANNYADANIVVQTLPNGPRKIVQRGGSFGRYVPSGHLVYVHKGTLFAAPFDLVTLMTGTGRPVIENIAETRSTGAAQFAFAADGKAVYRPWQTSSTDLPIEWLTRDGKITPLRATLANWSHPQFSPDGTRVAMDIIDNGQRDIAVYDWARDKLTHLTVDAQPDSMPVWTPDGQHIAFVSNRVADGRVNLYLVRADGGGDPEQLTDSASLSAVATGSWHGRFLAFQEGSQNVADLMILPMEGDGVSGWKPGKPYAFLNTPAAEVAPSFSPDGRWLAYQSNESGRFEVHVRPFPKREGSWRVSNGGGQGPIWSRAKDELLYLTLDNQIMAASYTVVGDSFRAEAPKLWTERRILLGPVPTFRRMMDLHPDGERVAGAVATEGQAEDRPDKLVFIFNFFDELRRIASATKH